MKTGAELSACRKYRFALWRKWDDSKPYVMFIGLNPSTADEKEDDPTIKRCINFAKEWGYGGLYMTNLFSYRATSPSDMKKVNDPVGLNNDMWLLKFAQQSDKIIASWGNDGAYLGRSNEVKKLLQKIHYLKMNKSGEPSHPLYLKSDLKPIKWDL